MATDTNLDTDTITEDTALDITIVVYMDGMDTAMGSTDMATVMGLSMDMDTAMVTEHVCNTYSIIIIIIIIIIITMQN